MADLDFFVMLSAFRDRFVNFILTGKAWEATQLNRRALAHILPLPRPGLCICVKSFWSPQAFKFWLLRFSECKIRRLFLPGTCAASAPTDMNGLPKVLEIFYFGVVVMLVKMVLLTKLGMSATRNARSLRYREDLSK